MGITTRCVRSAWAEIRACLQREKDHVYGEIRNYPTPIAGCDQQFNALLERRTEVAREWARLNEAEAASLAAEDPIAIVEEFIRTSNCLDGQAGESIARHLREGGQ